VVNFVENLEAYEIELLDVLSQFEKPRVDGFVKSQNYRISI